MGGNVLISMLQARQVTCALSSVTSADRMHMVSCIQMECLQLRLQFCQYKPHQI